MSSTDVPLVHPAFVHAVVAALDAEVDVALPMVLAFRSRCRPPIALRCARSWRSCWRRTGSATAFLFERCRVRRLDERRCSPTAG